MSLLTLFKKLIIRQCERSISAGSHTHHTGKMSRIRAATSWRAHQAHLRDFQPPHPIQELASAFEDGTVQWDHELTEDDMTVMAAMGDLVTSVDLELFYNDPRSSRTPSPPPNFFDGQAEGQILDDLGLLESNPWDEGIKFNPFALEETPVVRSTDFVTADSSGSQLLAVLGPFEYPEEEVKADPVELIESTAFGQVVDTMMSRVTGPWRQVGSYDDMSIDDMEALF
jgi:hypothetical protein